MTELMPYSSCSTVDNNSCNENDTTCADPESFVRGGPNLITFFLVVEGLEDPNSTINGPSSARQRNAIEMAFRWRADDGPTLNASLVALCQGIRTSIAQKPYIFVIFQGGPDPLSPPSGSALDTR